jgi:hypothetical protein
VRATVSSRDDAKACSGHVDIREVTKADGSPCYTFETYVSNGTACESIIYTWKDPSGQVIASGANGFSNLTTITCAATGESANCQGPQGLPPSGGCCGVTGFGTAACSDGVACSSGACP